jgi:CRP-like cAMP-binding protein
MMHSAWNPQHDRVTERLDQRRQLLARVAMLGRCSKEAFDDLLERVVVRAHPAETVLVAQGEPAEAACFIGAGRVRLLLADESGRELNLAQLGTGDLVGESALFEGQTSATTALALDDVVLLKLSREAFLGHAQRHPLSALSLAGELHRRVVAAHGMIAELAFDTVERRLVRTLERWGLGHGAVLTREGLLLRARPTHQELAQMTGSARETITRAFSSLTRRGLITRHGSGLLLSQALLESA